jgi:hypothetical protein
MTAIPFDPSTVRKPRASQSQLRAMVGIALLVLTVGTQLIWSLAIH